MSNFEDDELEARLRRIASGVQPEATARMHRRLREIATSEPGRTDMGVTVAPLRPMGRTWPGLRTSGMLAAAAAAIVVAVALSGLLVAQRGRGPGATWAPRTDVGTGQWTAIEWHDITATAGGLLNPVFVAGGGYSMPRVVVSWQGGLATMGGDYLIWTSSDGITWSESASSPWMAQPVPTPDGTALLAYSWGQGASDPAMWRSTDGRSWEQVAVPFGRGVSLIANRVGDIAVVTDLSTAAPSPLSAIWLTTDGATWTQNELPSDLAAARNVVVTSFATGFVAVGEVVDPKGSTSACDDKGNCTSYSDRAWRSIDGRTWSSYGPTIPPTGMTSNYLPWYEIRPGSLGMTDGSIYSTDGGTSWQAETQVGLPAGEVRLHAWGLVSDGTRVLGAAGSIAHLYLTEGDGRWTELRQGGDVRSLPSSGSMAIVPGGILWIGADHVYFGQALSGIEPRGSIGPPITPSPGSSLATPAEAVPTLTPVAIPTATPTPTTPAAAPALTTTGLLTGWSGFSWSSGQKPGSNAIGKVIKWSGGYAATSGAGTNPSSSLWTSPDGENWTPVTSIPGPWYYLSAAPGGLVVIAVGYGGRSAPDQTFPTRAPSSATVWTSTDGVTWRDLGAPDLGQAVVSVAGTSSGLVATVLAGDGSARVEFSIDGLHWTATTVEPGLAWDQAYAPVAVSNGSRFFLMGQTATALGLWGDPAGVVLTSSASRSYAWWSDDGRSWIRAGGSVGGNGTGIDFGRDGMVMTTDFTGFMPGGAGMAVSTDGGKTWTADTGSFGPLGAVSCTGECSSAADGVIGGNGTYIVAVKNGGKQAWLSYDGVTWTPIAWSGGDPSSASTNGFGGFTVLPRGVLLTGVYGAAH